MFPYPRIGQDLCDIYQTTIYTVSPLVEICAQKGTASSFNMVWYTTTVLDRFLFLHIRIRMCNEGFFPPLAYVYTKNDPGAVLTPSCMAAASMTHISIIQTRHTVYLWPIYNACAQYSQQYIWDGLTFATHC